MKALLTALLFVVALIPSRAEEKVAPSGVKYDLIGTYDLARLQKILTSELQEFSSFEVTYPAPKHAVKLYRVTYPSVIPEQSNRPTRASGLLAVPDTKGDTFPVMSYQHGTVFTKTAVPSHPEESMETRLMIANFAAQGYIVVAADYFGKGLSPETDSYIVKASTQQACFDHLKAAEAVSADLQLNWGKLHLFGWSQGGWATLSFLNKLEESGVPVTAVGVASGPTDVYALISGWIHAPAEDPAAFIPAALCLQLHATEAYFQIPGLAASAIRPEYHETARDLYLNKISYEEAYPKLPKTSKGLFNEAFLAAGNLNAIPYWQIIQRAQNYRWRAITPTHIYSGGSDEIGTPAIMNLPIEFQKLVGGAEFTGVDAGKEANHRGTFLFAMEHYAKLLQSQASAE